MFSKHRFNNVRNLVKMMGVLGLTLGLSLGLSACQDNSATTATQEKSQSVHSNASSKKAATTSKARSDESSTSQQATSKSANQASESTESSDTTATAVNPAQSQSETKASSSSAQVQITSGDQAVTYLQEQVGAQYPSTTDDPVIYGFIQTTTVQNQPAYRVEIGKNNGRSTIAVYNVLADGQIIQVN